MVFRGLHKKEVKTRLISIVSKPIQIVFVLFKTRLISIVSKSIKVVFCFVVAFMLELSKANKGISSKQNFGQDNFYSGKF